MRCPRCSGCLHHAPEETFCLNCGWRENAPLPEPFVTPRIFGTSDCRLCGKRREKRSMLCHGCAISEGFAKQRDLA